MGRGAWQATAHGSQNQIRLKQLKCTLSALKCTYQQVIPTAILGLLSISSLLPNKNSLSVHAKLPQLCPTLCNAVDCSPPGSSAMGFSREEYWSWLPFPPPGDFPIIGIQPVFLRSPTLVSGFFFLLPLVPPGMPPNSLPVQKWEPICSDPSTPHVPKK